MPTGRDSESYIDKVQCNICKGQFRADISHINLICKLCQNKERQELIGEFIEGIKPFLDHIMTVNLRMEIETEIEKWEARVKYE